MNLKTKIIAKYIIVSLISISFLVLLVTGLIKFAFIQRIAFQNTLFAMAQLSNLHDWSGVVFIVFAILHIIMNLDWFISAFRVLSRKK